MQELGVQTLVKAIDAGCTFFDTAVLYGRSMSETMIGEALRRRPTARDRVTITTKAGRSHLGYDFSFDAILRSVDESLERMGLDRLELVYIHDAMGQPMDEVLSDRGALGALRHLQKQGIINLYRHGLQTIRRPIWSISGRASLTPRSSPTPGA